MSHVNFAVGSCHSPRRVAGVRNVGARRDAPTPWTVMEWGGMPGGGCHPRPGHRGVRNARLHGCHRARADLMAHAPRRCGVCRLVEPLGLVHVPNGLRNPRGPITTHGDRCHELAERLWPKVAGPWCSTPEHPIRPGDCWPWLGARGDDVYGRVRLGRRGDGLVGPHRAVLLLADAMQWPAGQAPDRCGLEACHNCPGGDFPLCCNPAHLYWGTPAENAADRLRNGRHGSQRRRATVNGRAYQRYLEQEAVLRELAETAAELEAER
jgi:hypothetical protein